MLQVLLVDACRRLWLGLQSFGSVNPWVALSTSTVLRIEGPEVLMKRMKRTPPSKNPAILHEEVPLEFVGCETPYHKSIWANYYTVIPKPEIFDFFDWPSITFYDHLSHQKTFLLSIES